MKFKIFIILFFVITFLWFPVKAEIENNNQNGVFEIGIFPESTTEYLRIRYSKTFCNVPDLQVTLLSGPNHNWTISKNTSTGFVIVVNRDVTGYRETMRFSYSASGNIFPCLFNTFIPFIQK